MFGFFYQHKTSTFSTLKDTQDMAQTGSAYFIFHTILTWFFIALAHVACLRTTHQLHETTPSKYMLH